MADAQDQDTKWRARLTPVPGGADIERLLQMSLGLDILPRQPNAKALEVLAYEGQLKELERRRLASVERLYTEGEYLSEKESDEEEPQA